MAEEIKLRWPQDANPLTDEQVLNETPVMAADTADENRMVSVTIGQIAQKAGQSIAVNGQRIKAVPAGALPAQGAEQVYMELRGPGVWTWDGIEIINLSAREVGSVWWDGSAWSLEDEQELPTSPSTDVIELGNFLPAESEAVYLADQVINDKVTLMLNEEQTEVVHEDVNPDAIGFGASSNAYGWGFSSKARTNIVNITIKLSSTQLSTSQSITVRENNKTGTILKFKTFSQSIQGGALLVNFDFSEDPILNPNNAKLWIEVRSNSTLVIYRVSPAEVFTSAEGYPVISFTTTNNVNGTTLPTNSTNVDVYHEITNIEEGITDISQWMKDRISENVNITVTEVVELGNTNPVESNAVAVEVDRIDDTISQIATYESVIVGEQTFMDVNPTSSALGAGTIGGWGFPLKARQNIIKIKVKIVNTVASTSQRMTIRENDRDGALLYDNVFNQNIAPSGAGDIVEFDLGDIILNPNNVKLWVELYSATTFGIFRVTPAVVFTEADGYPFVRTTTSLDMGITRVFTGGPSSYYDVYHEVVVAVVEEGYQFTEHMREQISEIAQDSVGETESNVLPNENQRISFTGSSVTWGDGYLQSGYLTQYILWKQSKVAQSVLANSLSVGVTVNNRQYFSGQARRVTGAGQEIEFQIKGNEVSIVQGIDRVNTNASEIEVYIDGNLHDTFNNFNTTPIGSNSRNFVGDGNAVMFDLGQAFTYSHTVTLAGVSQVVTHNITQNTGFTIPVGSDCAIIRRLGTDSEGNPAVTHWLWFKVAPTAGQAIVINYLYGRNLMYEKTTIGQNTAGANESPYGDGDTSFDPLEPSAIATGLDFRETDDRVVKTYRFLDSKERTVRIRIKGLFGGATGTPYFLFNFATNRYFHFQNAGIGGWDLWDLDRTIAQDALRGWQRVIQFNPDKLVIETTPNDDWIVRGHKVYSTDTLSLTDIRSVKNLPLRSIEYNSGSDDYTMTRWRGFITAITEVSVTLSGTIETPIVSGDVVMIGQYWGNNFDYIERTVASVAGNVISFNKPIGKDEIIYNSLQDFVGKEIGVRSLVTFKTKLEGLIDKIRGVTDCPIYLLENPMPNVLARELWGYPIIMDSIANSKVNVHSIDYMSLREWQMSQAKESLTLDASTAVMDTYLGERVIEFGTNGKNILAVDVLLDGVSIYGSRAVIQNGWAYTVNQTATGTSLNKLASGTVNSGQVYNGRTPRLVILDDTLTSGVLTIQWSGSLWSNDSCHMNANSAKLYADFLQVI